MRAGTLLWSFASLTVLAGCAGMSAYQRDQQDLKIERTPERVARGDYLVNHVMTCVGCHTLGMDTPKGADPAMLLAGGERFGHDLGLPGELYTPNLTSDPETGLGNWTDGEILDAIRNGRAKDGSALFPIMPYMSYHAMSDEDAYAIVAYLRTLKPVHNPVPARSLDFPLNLMVNMIPPSPLTAPVAPPPTDPVQHGAYLVKMASCADCHTGPGSSNPPFSGGMFFPMEGEGPGGKGIPAANITQDKEFGIGSWSDDAIKLAIRGGVRPDGKVLREPMPWAELHGVSDADITDMVAYLRTIPPVHKEITGRW